MNTDVLHDTATGEESRICTLCKRVQVLVSEGWKMCPQCREKSRERSRARALKLKALAADAEPDAPTLKAIESGNTAKRKADDATNLWQDMKKRFKKSSKDREGKNGTSGVLGTVTNTPSGSRTIEFQTASDMYKALKTMSKAKKPLQFHGSFSIVAKDDTDDIKRARLVMDELRKIAKISFAYKKPSSSASHLLTFKCTCMASAHPTKAAPAVPPNEAAGDAVSLKSKQSALTAWAGAKPKMSHEPGISAAPTVECNGKVMIVAEEDSSHPLGIKGQKVTVVVEH